MRQAKSLALEMVSSSTHASTYYEPFLGGGSVAAQMARLLPHHVEMRLSDSQPDLILLWQAVLSGYEPPLTLDRETYELLRHGAPSPERGWAGFAGSYCGKWFGGYGPTASGRDYLSESWRAMQKKMAPLCTRKSVSVSQLDYRELYPAPGSIIYLDPPYEGTTSFVGVDAFNTAEFWSVARSWAQDACCHVYVSEFAAPADWRPIRSDERFSVVGVISLGAEAKRDKEYLFVYDGETSL